MIARAFILRLNEVKGQAKGYETAGESFQEVARHVRWHMDHDGRTEADFLAVAGDMWRQWKGTIREKNCKPSTLLRHGMFGEYLAEVGQPVASAAPTRGRVVGESANVANLLAEREKSPEQKQAEWEDYCRKLGVHA